MIVATGLSATLFAMLLCGAPDMKFSGLVLQMFLILWKRYY